MPEGRGKMNHGNMSYDDKPCFYKIIFDDQAEKARIPYGFMKHIPNEELGTATLESSSGRRWSVELRRKKDGLFITDGWQEFIRDNSLVNYELVLFTYDGKKHFSVQIFDPSGLEKASAPLIASMYQEAASSSKIKRKRGRPRKSTVSPFNLRRPKPRDGASGTPMNP
ncbi:hypothetical protein RJ640_016484 [Escallonia rubra]|uniref:TF-B3 domain-containing protein n=1 Tax=Escallonia rubra TaxID=112253 RepID=A0AA88QXT9_9ASTE|nr:hypothetical protein RJ640_016484 [Escallonia rubra]